ncbi:unnamed protein product [Acanthocheilonema viteae]|uniref:Uncharacterized protein n=1 Tax=Acanthocheilonema viteae TaxID=6277 RepID=A0A498SPS5_ACAVI|nr:unnamed protein product [Acanthocheilonema viteae]VBB33783.1 unnamed protein product [Acanthocheilonema viteae]VBB34678.1 unnamed protein product [Acanthocheilonema viteae]
MISELRRTEKITSFPDPKNKELKSERCILLQLISSVDEYAYDLLAGGFFFETKVPSLLFRYATKENYPFTARLFADTRFGTHRSRPDHQTLRRIQHAAAFLAITNNNIYNSASASLSHIDNTTSENPENHNLEPNNPDISQLQYNVSRMSLADDAAPKSSTLAPYHSNMY